MNPSYTVLPDRQLICLHYDGDTTFERWQATLEAALAECGGQASVDLLIDRRGVAGVPSTATIHLAVEFFERHSHQLRRVASVVEDGAVYGMCRMLEALSQRTSVEYRVFRSYDEAGTWLGHSPDQPLC